tara:strand:- start:1329 stop:1523 length:195 start_codon:yes stop_codon:yes gene_type:complete
MDRMTKWKLPTLGITRYAVKWILVMITLVVSTIALYMDAGDVWYCIWMLAIVKMSDMVDESGGK